VNERIKRLKKKILGELLNGSGKRFVRGQKRVRTVIRNRNITVNEEVQVIKINSESLITHFKNLYEQKTNATAVQRDETKELLMRLQDINEEDTEEEENISHNDVQETVNRKAPGIDNIPNELIKAGGDAVIIEITKLLQKIIGTGTILTEWKSSITILIFKKGSKKNLENYRGITLLSSIRKVLTKIL
jgi:hypothetical protein